MGCNRFQIGFVFVECDQFNTTIFIQNCIYMNFRINLTQFYINFSRQEHQIEVLYIQNLIFTFWYNFDTVLCQFLETRTSDRCLIGIVQLLRFSGFSLYPLSFFLYTKRNTSLDSKILTYF